VKAKSPDFGSKAKRISSSRKRELSEELQRGVGLPIRHSWKPNLRSAAYKKQQVDTTQQKMDDIVEDLMYCMDITTPRHKRQMAFEEASPIDLKKGAKFTMKNGEERTIGLDRYRSLQAASPIKISIRPPLDMQAAREEQEVHKAAIQLTNTINQSRRSMYVRQTVIYWLMYQEHRILRQWHYEMKASKRGSKYVLRNLKKIGGRENSKKVPLYALFSQVSDRTE